MNVGCGVGHGRGRLDADQSEQGVRRWTRSLLDYPIPQGPDVMISNVRHRLCTKMGTLAALESGETTLKSHLGPFLVKLSHFRCSSMDHGILTGHRASKCLTHELLSYGSRRILDCGQKPQEGVSSKPDELDARWDAVVGSIVAGRIHADAEEGGDSIKSRGWEVARILGQDLPHPTVRNVAGSPIPTYARRQFCFHVSHGKPRNWSFSASPSLVKLSGKAFGMGETSIPA